jgi:predicted nucleic acid-binding protein
VTLVDTSVWIDHLHRPDKRLVFLLEEEAVLVHPFVIGELSLGHLRQRNRFLHDLSLLPLLPPASDPQVLEWIGEHRLFGKGLNWADAHLLLSCLLNDAEFWTRDKVLWKTAVSAGIKTRPNR